MPGNFKKEDLRIIKTQKSIFAALEYLLNIKKFSRIKVNDICEEAQLSRVAFYMHFKDKYDLLKHWLQTLKKGIAQDENFCTNLINEVNNYICQNIKIVRNLLYEADDITLRVLHFFILSLLEIDKTEAKKGKHSNDYIVLSNFCSGGIIKLLNYHAENYHRKDMLLFGSRLSAILKMLLEKKIK